MRWGSGEVAGRQHAAKSPRFFPWGGVGSWDFGVLNVFHMVPKKGKTSII